MIMELIVDHLHRGVPFDFIPIHDLTYRTKVLAIRAHGKLVEWSVEEGKPGRRSKANPKVINRFVVDVLCVSHWSHITTM